MTKFFEVEERDGAARLGKLLLDKNIKTPLLVESSRLALDPDYPIQDMGTLWEFGTDDAEEVKTMVFGIKKRGEAAENENENKNKRLFILPRAQFSLTYPEKEDVKRNRKIREAVLEAEMIGKIPLAGMIRPNTSLKHFERETEENACGDAGFRDARSIPEEQKAGDCCASNVAKPIAADSEAESAGLSLNSSSGFENLGYDVYIMEGAGTFEEDAIGFFNAFLSVKSKIPYDSALWLSNLATPENAAVLIWMGADILDTVRAEVAAYNDMYMTTAGTFYLDDLEELPCRCTACVGKSAKMLRDMKKAERARLLEIHNIGTLEAEISLVREKIRKNALREYVEGQCRTKTWLTGLLRLYDRRDLSDFAEQNAPVFRRETMYATTAESQTRAEIVRFAHRVTDLYEAPKKEILIIFPCAMKKPYSISNSHQRFIQAIERNRKYVNEIIITSPIGLVPRELELTYPAAHYDTTVTGHWDLEERAWVGGLLEAYLSKNKTQYKHIIAHVEGPYREICVSVSEKLGIPMILTGKKSLTSQESLKQLRAALDDLVNASVPANELTADSLDEQNQNQPNQLNQPNQPNQSQNKKQKQKPTLLKRNPNEEKWDQARAIIRYQFGPIGDTLFSKETVIKGNFPKFQIFDQNEQLATLVPQFGQFAISLAGAQKIIQSPNYAGQYTVRIDNFLPKGSLLAPGIIDADENIRVGDDVIILGENAIGVGKAKMTGKEMKISTKGVAVLPRHTKWIAEPEKK
ncbi:archaeosine synthase subunit alpha [Methanolapillus ohkumae]|uniref:PUA domain-containing protein n=1 Tax=Methanolapillus ohkumae TaxID=3028298 RepID=A0AA96VDM8_9EURY|nr:hypothetical protein MsAm2_01160 [Methanosarcinaceae archaeon Am2]